MGMSHPAKSTSLAPWARCCSISGVCLMAYAGLEEGSNSEQFDFEDKCCVGRYGTAGTAGAISQIGGDNEFPLPADFHALHAFVPTFDHSTGSQRKGEGLPSIHRTVELLPILQPAAIMHADGLAGLSRAPVPTLSSIYCNPDEVVTSLPSGPACSNGMSTP